MKFQLDQSVIFEGEEVIIWDYSCRYNERGRIMFSEIEDYINHLVNERYIYEDGRPIKCLNCESTNFDECDYDSLDTYKGRHIGVLEYTVKCKDCNKNVGHWVAGQWQII